MPSRKSKLDAFEREIRDEIVRTEVIWKKVHKASLTDEHSDNYDLAQRLSGKMAGLSAALIIYDRIKRGW